jgi:hypothetical protein
MNGISLGEEALYRRWHLHEAGKGGDKKRRSKKRNFAWIGDTTFFS